jgi:hypothetical protein
MPALSFVAWPAAQVPPVPSAAKPKAAGCAAFQTLRVVREQLAEVALQLVQDLKAGTEKTGDERLLEFHR